MAETRRVKLWCSQCKEDTWFEFRGVRVPSAFKEPVDGEVQVDYLFRCTKCGTKAYLPTLPVDGEKDSFQMVSKR